MRVIQSAAVLLIAALAACSGDEPIVPTPTAAASAPHSSGLAATTTPIVFNMPTGRIALAPLTVELEPNRGIGTVYRNVDCWVRVRSVMPEDFPQADRVTLDVQHALADAKLATVLVTSPDVAAAGGADYLLVGSVPAAHADSCTNSFFNDGPADIDAQVGISWHLWSVRDKRVVYETTTGGTAHISDPGQRITLGVDAAIADSVRQFLENATVQQYLTYGRVVPIAMPVTTASVGAAPAAAVPIGGAAPIPQPPAGIAMPRAELPPILVPVKPAFPATAAIDATASRRATVTLGTGSAAVALGEGYLLTASAALGDAPSVGVTIGGTVVQAQVLRKDGDAGVALLKVDGALPSAVPLQPRRNAAGDKVFGVGPAGLVTGSIVSTRANGGRDAVKLDGAVAGGPVLDAAGNVIGILLPDGGFASVGTVFRALQLGAQPSDE